MSLREELEALTPLDEPFPDVGRRMLAIAAANLALEAAARECDGIEATARPQCEANYTDGDAWVATCAAAIRAMRVG